MFGRRKERFRKLRDLSGFKKKFRDKKINKKIWDLFTPCKNVWDEIHPFAQ